MANKHKEENGLVPKVAFLASDEDSGSLDSTSSESLLDADVESEAAKQQKLVEGEDSGECDKAKASDMDEHLDSTSRRLSKRKPSKSRIKRIINELSVSPMKQLTPGSPYPLPPIDSLMGIGQPMSQASMVPDLSLPYSMQFSPRQQHLPGASAYKCEVCNKIFRVPSRYEAHMKSHSKGKPFCCDVCGKMFATEIKLKVHKPIHEQDRKAPFTCQVCNTSCSSWRAYQYHVSKHTDDQGKKHVCPECGRKFYAAQRLRNHMDSHRAGKNFCCMKCGKLFESQKRLDTHSLIHDSERREPYACVDCGKVYQDWRAFKQHMKTHGSDGFVYSCEICEATFLTQYEKEKHMKVHPVSEKHQCGQCSKSFWSVAQLMTHQHNKHRNNSQRQACPICGRECARSSGLKQHMKMHAGEGDDFFCHLCGSTFQVADDLAAHAMTHNHDRQFTCSQCRKSFVKEIHYHRHLAVHAEDQKFLSGIEHSLELTSHTAAHTSDKQQEFTCIACNLTFVSFLELKAHAHTHGNISPHICGICGKQFSERRYFKQHLKRHKDGREIKKRRTQQASWMLSETAAPSLPSGGAHACHMCGQMFARSQDLAEHVEEHTRNGYQRYMKFFGAKENSDITQQKQQKVHDADREPGSASYSSQSDDICAPESKFSPTIHFGMQTPSLGTSTPQGSRDMNGPVFPGPSNGLAKICHDLSCRAQNSQENYTNGSSDTGNGMEVTGWMDSTNTTKMRLPDFSDFRRQLGSYNQSGYSDNPESLSAPCHSSSTMGHFSTGACAFPEGLSPSASSFPSSGKPVAGSGEACMPMYPSMSPSVFPNMPSHGLGNMAASVGDQSQFKSIFQSPGN